MRAPSDLFGERKVPRLRTPVMIAAFEGWNDAGEAASLAVAHLARASKAVVFAEIDPEEFFDFTQVRPDVALADGVRRIVWPGRSNAFDGLPEGHLAAVADGAR